MAAALAYGLTRTQRDCLLIIQELTAIDGVSPSLDEICHEMSLTSRGRVHRLLLDLHERGFIEWLPFRRRTLTVVRPIPMPDEPAIVGFFAPPGDAA